MVATYADMIKGLHTFDYSLDSLDPDILEKLREKSKKQILPEKKGGCASFEKMIKGLHSR